MQALDIKLLRDLLRMKVQALAIAMVMACGVAVIILALGAYRSIDETRAAYYDRQGFADIFSPLVRAPNYLKTRIQQIPGVSGVELRIVEAACFLENCTFLNSPKGRLFIYARVSPPFQCSW